jgi:hypothetical protein
MAKYPVENGDADGIADGVNYVLSGPSGLGQYNVGFNTSADGYVTGNFRLPYSSPSFELMYRAPIALGNSTWLDDFTWKYEFASPQIPPPFNIGNNITVTGVTPSDYDGTFNRIGVVYCDQNYVIARATGSYPNPGPGTGGTVSWQAVAYDFPGTLDDPIEVSTDCNGILSVVGPEDFVNLSAQIDCSQKIGISISVEEPGINFGSIAVSTQLNRYKAFNSGTAANPQYFYEFDATVAEQVKLTPLTGGIGQVLAVSIDATSGTKVDTTPSGFFATFTPPFYTTTGSGVNLYFSIDLPSSAAGAYVLYDPVAMTGNTDFIINSPGYLYAVNDLITIDGNDLGGVSGVNDLVLRVTSANTTVTETRIDPTATFTTLLDNPTPGLYWYILELEFQPGGVDVIWHVDYIELGRRSLTAQIVKK